MKMILSLILTLSMLLFFSCSSTPTYLKKNGRTYNQASEKFSESYEKLLLNPVRENIKKNAIEYDLSVVPKNVSIKKAVLRAGIKEKSILARSLGSAKAKDLSRIIKPTPFYGSRIKNSSLPYIFASHSTIEFETHTLSLLERGGGTGGKATYSSKNPGYDEWEVTELVEKNKNTNKPFTFSFADRAVGNSDITIFSNSYVVQHIGYMKNEKNNYTQLTIYYE